MMLRNDAKVMAFVQAYQEMHGGASPSCRETAVGIGWSPKSQAAVRECLNRMEKRGLISRVQSGSKVPAIMVLKPIRMVARTLTYTGSRWETSAVQVGGYWFTKREHYDVA